MTLACCCLTADAQNSTLKGVGVTPTGTLQVSSNPAELRARGVFNTVVAINAPGTAGITLSTVVLTFAYIPGGTPPGSQSFGVLGLGGTASYSVSATTNSGGDWLAASPASGQTPGNVTVSVQNLASLSQGSYQGTVTVQPFNNSMPAQSVGVSLEIASPQPQLSVSATDLRFQVVAGSPAVTRLIQVSNTGGGTINYSAGSSGSGLSITCGAQGAATSSHPGRICLQVDPTGLSAGTYSGSLTVSGAGANVSVSVTLQVSSAATYILLSAPAITFTAVAGDLIASPRSQTVAVLNGGQGTMNWMAQPEASSNSPWLTSTPGTGSSDAFGATQPEITFIPSPFGLAPGNYYARIDVTVPDGSAANSPNTITVLLKILPAGSQVPLAVSTSGLIFTAAVGGTAPAAQELDLTNAGVSAVGYSFTAATDDGQSWLSASPVTGTVPAGGSSPLSVQVNPIGLVVGVYYGQVRFGFSNGAAENVDVVLLVAPAAGASTAEDRNIPAHPKDTGSCLQYGISFVQPVPTNGATVTAGQSYKLQVHSLCVPDPPSALNLEIDFNDRTGPLIPVYVSNGTYETTWAPVVPKSVQFFAQSNPTNAAGLPVGATSTATFSVTVGALDPKGSAIVGGVRNSASYVTANEVAAGSFISIFGQQLASSQASASTTPFPTKLGGFQATLGGVPLPLYSTAAGQVNAIVPFLKDQSLNTALPLVVQRDNTTAPPVPLSLVQFQPGIFSTNQQGSGQGAIDNASNQLVDSSHPAKPGDTIVIYGAGLGTVMNPPEPGALAGPGSLTVNQPTVYIDGIQAQVTYSGLSPGSVQLYQVNAVVPKGIHSGTINVYLTINDVQSNTVTIN